MTFSLVARCDATGLFGCAVTSSSPAVGARCAWARARVGAACTQNVTDPTLGNALLDRLAAGESAAAALTAVRAQASHVDHRQLCAIGSSGAAAAFSGALTLGRHASSIGEACAAAGNLLADDGVPDAMTAAFAASSSQPLGDRLVTALRAGRDAGGEESPVHSAGLLVVDAVPWPVADLRVDWSDDDPIEQLAALWERWQPLADDYVLRALDPGRAPSYGVPGDE